MTDKTNRFSVRVEDGLVIVELTDSQGRYAGAALAGAHAATLAMTIGLCSQTVKGGMLGVDDLHERLHADGATDITGGVQFEA